MMKITNKIDAINEILRISAIKNISIELSRAYLCDVCDYCIRNNGKCVLQNEAKVLRYIRKNA